MCANLGLELEYVWLRNKGKITESLKRWAQTETDCKLHSKWFSSVAGHKQGDNHRMPLSLGMLPPASCCNLEITFSSTPIQ